MSKEIQANLCCPICKSQLYRESNGFKCINDECKHLFPLIGGIPVIINDNSSLFSIKDFTNIKDTTFKSRSNFKSFILKYLPKISLNIKSQKNYEFFKKLLFERNQYPRILVIGGSIIGDGMDSIISESSIELIESDVSFGPRTKIICDAHDLPFKDNSFDGVIIQAVLEHVVDPRRCVNEIYRVLKNKGLVYSETPFMQQVHMGKYDFTRFTNLGHRYIFRNFEEICDGVIGGPGMALAWSYQYFLLSFVQSSFMRDFIQFFARITAFWLKYFDLYLAKKAGSFDAAAGYYFMGVKSKKTLSSKELIKLYKGTQL